MMTEIELERELTEIRRLRIEADKFYEESLKVRYERLWYPMIAGASLLAAGAGLATALAHFWK